MSQLNRAKIFAPFAALVGFDERVRRKEINYVAKHELDADEEWALNQKLYELYRLTGNSREARANAVRVSIEYFVICDDEENDAYRVKGQYKTITGVVMKVDQNEQRITVRDESGSIHVIAFGDIHRIFELGG